MDPDFIMIGKMKYMQMPWIIATPEAASTPVSIEETDNTMITEVPN